MSTAQSPELTRSECLLLRRVPMRLLMWEYLLIGVTGFGGGLQARFYHVAVVKHEWLCDEEFVDVNASASLAPGGNASNVGLEIGRRLRGIPGMIAAQICLLLPGTVIMLAAGRAYEAHQGNVVLQGALQGLQSAATALILYSATKLGLSTWRWPDYIVAAAACLGMEALHAPLWVVLPVGALLSLWVYKRTGR